MSPGSEQLVDHIDVGAYALGLLENDDRRRFERHLGECPSCESELDDFAGIAGALADVDPSLISASGADDAGPEPDGSVVELSRRRADDRAERRFRLDHLVAVAAATVLLVGGLIIGSWFGGGSHDTTASDSGHKPAGALLLTGERFSASDQATGATGVIGVENRGWGTHIALELRGVHGPLECQLVVLSRTGERQVAMSWEVPRAGYGVPGSPGPLVLHGATSMRRADIRQVEVDTRQGKRLLTVPL